MQIVESEIKNVVVSPQRPNYNSNNPILRIARAVERVQFAALREAYLPDSLQYLFPYLDLGLYSPAGNDSGMTDPRGHENKEDFQKQNIADFKLRDIYLVRGYASAGNWVGPFLQVSFRGSGTELERLNGRPLGPFIQMWIKVGANATQSLVRLPYNEATDRYEVELWGFSGGDLPSVLDSKARSAFDAGRLVARPDLVRGNFGDFRGSGFDAERENGNRAQPDPQAMLIFGRAPEHAMHPVRALRVELAFTDATARVWDSLGGKNYRLEFNMLLRGWQNYLAVGVSPNPHGGIGYLEFRNLFSNYFGYERQRRGALGDLWENELGRDLDSWNHDSNTWEFGDRLNAKAGGAKRERFMAVDYMDLHLLQPECGIGVHRHRDNQEVFLMLHGKGMMVLGDWCQFSSRERCFEVRTMLPGDLTVCKTGQLHALYNKTDAPCELFMFGGYD
jgi:mannose-6-phosphate isomerase-like protein (cupin superfamily)